MCWDLWQKQRGLGGVSAETTVWKDLREKLHRQAIAECQTLERENLTPTSLPESIPSEQLTTSAGNQETLSLLSKTTFYQFVVNALFCSCRLGYIQLFHAFSPNFLSGVLSCTPCVTFNLHRHVMTQKSDIPAEQLGPNTLSSAQFSQAVPPNPSCRTPRERMLDLSRLCYPSLVSICLSNIPSLCACPEAPFSFFLALFVL